MVCGPPGGGYQKKESEAHKSRQLFSQQNEPNSTKNFNFLANTIKLSDQKIPQAPNISPD
jgi:hypothetical protein